MKKPLLIFAFTFFISAFAMLFGQVAVATAIGPATDNTTMPTEPNGDQVQDEIKPLVEYVLLGESLQRDSETPGVINTFIGTSEGGQFEVRAGETWYLDVDINMPGWLYIYDYFPAGETIQGQWIAYKWQLQQSGVWRFGPFIASDNLPEGQHIYRTWFYSDGQWASEEQGMAQGNLIYWTYLKGQPAVQVPPQSPVVPVKETSGITRLYETMTQPVVLVIGTILAIVMVAVALYLLDMLPWWRRIPAAMTINPAVHPGNVSVAEPAVAASAKVVLPNGIEIMLDDSGRVLGRGDLARALSLDQLSLISRRHFQIKVEGEKFYIEDLDSSNGTLLNDEDISGRGPVSLTSDDVIEPAGVIKLRFLLL